jgi:hypothetical protein
VSAYGPTSLGTSKTVFAGEIPRFTVAEATSDDWEPDDGSFRALIVVLALPMTQGASKSCQNQKPGKKSGRRAALMLCALWELEPVLLCSIEHIESLQPTSHRPK